MPILRAMAYDANIPPPPKPLAISDLIRGLPPKRSVFIASDDAPPQSVRTIVSRVRSEYKSRHFQTAKENDGIRVWRTA